MWPYILVPVDLPSEIMNAVEDRNWAALDTAIKILVSPSGLIFNELKKHAVFTDIEFIISIRSSLEQSDEDGIWHDDGSRVLAFSLSLTPNSKNIDGGILEIKKKSDLESTKLETPPFGTMIIFRTGHDGFEHKINAVKAGERVIIAGWCT